jgi:hypothetical protein
MNTVAPNASLKSIDVTLNNSSWVKIVSEDVTRTYLSILNNASSYPLLIGFGTETQTPTNSFQISGGLSYSSTSPFGNESIFKFGHNPLINNIEETVWENGGIYTYPTSAVVMTVTSSAGATDNGVEILVSGLDENYQQASETVTLAGSGTATTSTTFIRVFRSYVAGSQDTTGNITISNGGITYAYVNGDNQTLMSVYTVPAGYTAYLTQTDTTVHTEANNKFATVRIVAREFGKVFRTQELFTAALGSVSRTYTVPVSFPEKTDIEARAIGSSSNANLHVAVTNEFTLVNNSVEFSNNDNLYVFPVAPINTVWAKTTSPVSHSISIIYDD